MAQIPGKVTLLILALTVTFGFTPQATPHDTPVKGQEFYQLKVYTFDTEDQMKNTDEYLKSALLPALKKQNIGPVGVFKNRPDDEKPLHKTYVLIPGKSLDAFVRMDDKLRQDEQYLEAGKNHLAADHDNPPYQRIESTMMIAFEEMPKMRAPEYDNKRSDRIYELRSYQSATEDLYRRKVDMFNAGEEIAIF